MKQPRASNHARRSFVLIAVLVIVSSALLVATGLLFLAQTEAAGASGTADAAQSRALSWSGVQAVMTRLNDQRDRILDGEKPILDGQFLMYEAGNRAGVVRVLPWRDSGERLIPESARIDLNHIDAAGLARSGLVDAATASAIMAGRDRSPGRAFPSLESLLHVGGTGITAETLLGPTADFRVVSTGPDSPLGEGGEATEPSPALVDHLTVFSAEPDLQQNGRLRINLNQSWSEELERLVADRFGKEAADLIKRIYEGGTTFDHDGKIVQTLRFFKTPLEDWPAILDAFTTEKSGLLTGRLNINAAHAEALQTLPGVTHEAALRLISTRQELSPAERSGIAWPVLADIITPDDFERIVSLITTRSWCYRVRVEAGTCLIDELDGPLSNRVILEAVIDLASPRPRVAYLRDITMLEDTVRIAHQASLVQSADMRLSNSASESSGGIDLARESSEQGLRTDDAAPSSDDEAATVPSSRPETPTARNPNRRGRWLTTD